MSCPADAPGPLHCPTFLESFLATLGLLPHGRAWPANDGGGTAARFLAWLGGLGAHAPRPDEWAVGYVQAGFFAAVASVRNYLETRLCALRLEFWCATMSETREQWMKEYGLPDPCDPFPDLCIKVAAIGGARCEYFNAVIARLGWSAVCEEKDEACGARVGCSRAGNRHARAGGSRGIGLQIIVHTNEVAPAPVVIRHYQVPVAGRFRAGQRPSCDTVVIPSVEPIRCLMDRIAPAHVQIVYVQ